MLIRENKTQKNHDLKLADLDTLKQAAVEGYVELKYLDESGCCRWSPVSYSYSRIGSQKQMAQIGSRGGRISILGLWQPQVSFEYALVQGGFKTKRYIEVMDWIAVKAKNTLVETGRISVIVHDNGSLHISKKAKQKWLEWQEKGLFVFFLPPYCSEMNRIEEEWHQLKTHEIAGQMFITSYQ
ncbi:hypothetical protein F8R90_29460 [Nostoc sp. NZL]|nr:hypothetical protein [Nostoc sp. NZL]